MPKGEKKALYPIYGLKARDMIENQGLTQEQVAKHLGLTRTTIQRWCKRFGWTTQRTGPRSGDKHTGWKGGRKLVAGYWYIYSPDHPRATKQHYMLEHRLVMERILGRYLEPNEVVHHIDGNRQNNAPDNLMVFAKNAAHLQHELTGRVPQWTDHGKARIAAGVAKAAAIHRKIKSDDDRRILSIDRQPS